MKLSFWKKEHKPIKRILKHFGNKKSLLVYRGSKSQESGSKNYSHVNFFDLGARNGWEADQFIHFFEKHKISYTVYSFEAFPEYFEDLKKKYSSNSNVEVLNYCITDTEETEMKLYIAAKSDGHSSIKSKDNLVDTENEFVVVPAKKLSEFIKERSEIKSEETINILKANIEGAEYYVLNELDTNNAFDFFDHYIGAGWITDMKKCTDLADKVPEALAIFEKHGKKTHYFARGPWEVFNIDIESIIPLSRFSTD